MVEQVLADYGLTYGLQSICLRYFNAAGADPDGEIGEDHDPETHLIPLVLETALGKRAVIRIFGDDYPTDDGTCVRDYIHVNDLAAAHLLAMGRGTRFEEKADLPSPHGPTRCRLLGPDKRRSRARFKIAQQF